MSDRHDETFNKNININLVISFSEQLSLVSQRYLSFVYTPNSTLLISVSNKCLGIFDIYPSGIYNNTSLVQNFLHIYFVAILVTNTLFLTCYYAYIFILSKITFIICQLYV